MRSWDYPRGPTGARLFMEVGVERGLTEHECLAGTGLTGRTLADPMTFVEAGQELRVLRNLIEHLGDVPGVAATAGLRVSLGGLGIWAFAVLTSPTLGAAMDVAVRFIRLSTVLTRIEHRPGPRETAIVFHGDELPDDIRDTVVERDLAALVPLLGGLLGELPPGRMETQFVGTRADAIETLLERRWRLLRGCREHALLLSNHVVAMPMPQADAVTHAVCRRECEQLLKARERRTSTTAAVRGQLLADQGARMTMDDVARNLHRSPRSLRRHLVTEGTTLHAIRDDINHQLATELLDTVGLSVAEVADRLGYSDPTSFSRAYKRWTGSPPTRRRHPAQAAPSQHP